jgi:hypothetical protein
LNRLKDADDLAAQHQPPAWWPRRE